MISFLPDAPAFAPEDPRISSQGRRHGGDDGSVGTVSSASREALATPPGSDGSESSARFSSEDSYWAEKDKGEIDPLEDEEVAEADAEAPPRPTREGPLEFEDPEEVGDGEGIDVIDLEGERELGEKRPSPPGT